MRENQSNRKIKIEILEINITTAMKNIAITLFFGMHNYYFSM